MLLCLTVFSEQQKKIQNGDICLAYCDCCESTWSTSNNTVRRLEQLWLVVVHNGILYNWWRSLQVHPRGIQTLPWRWTTHSRNKKGSALHIDNHDIAALCHPCSQCYNIKAGMWQSKTGVFRLWTEQSPRTADSTIRCHSD